MKHWKTIFSSFPLVNQGNSRYLLETYTTKPHNATTLLQTNKIQTVSRMPRKRNWPRWPPQNCTNVTLLFKMPSHSNLEVFRVSWGEMLHLAMFWLATYVNGAVLSQDKRSQPCYPTTTFGQRSWAWSFRFTTACDWERIGPDCRALHESQTVKNEEKNFVVTKILPFIHMTKAPLPKESPCLPC